MQAERTFYVEINLREALARCLQLEFSKTLNGMLTLKPDLSEIVVANMSKISIKCPGDAELETSSNRRHRILLKGVQFVPGLTTNLISVSQLIKNGNKVCFNESRGKIYNPENTLVHVIMSIY